MILPFLLTLAYAGGPKSTFPEPRGLDAEMQNIYHDIQAPIQSSRIIGTATNDDAASGIVGEYVSSTISNVSVPASGNFGDATSISLTAGDWEVWVFASMGTNGATVTDARIGVSTTSGNNAPAYGDGQIQISDPTSANFGGNATLSKRFSVAVSTTVYFKHEATYTVATPSTYGRIAARRLR